MDYNENANPISLQGWWLRLCRQRVWLMVCVFAGWALVSTVGWFLPARYRSQTLILVEQQRVPEHYVEPNVAIDLQQRLQSMSEQILSRTRLTSIIEKFHLYGNDVQRVDGDLLIERMRKDIGIELVKGEGKTDQISAFKVSYSANSPIVAQQVTAELTSLFIEENLKNRVELSEDTTGFLQTQLEDARKNLAQQELRLKEFKSKYLGQLPEQTASNLQILAGLQGRLQSATDGLNQAEQQRLYIDSLSAQYRAMRTGTGNENAQLLNVGAPLGPDQKLQQLKAEEAELEAKYTPLHPDVVRLKEEIAAAEKLKASAEQTEKRAQARTGPEAPLHATTAAELQTLAPFLQVESQKKANELEVMNRKAEIKRVQAEIDSYQQRLNLAPAREQELANITRDHEQSRANYESLLAKKNQSEMATNLEKRQQGEQFRMIDPPSLPQKPYFPNRVLFCFGGLVLGVVACAGVVLLLELSNPLIFQEDELHTLVAAPILLTLPPIVTAAENRKKLLCRGIEIAAATVMALVIPAVTLFIYKKG
jgi:polysaccharide biosynthesis transport protein